MNRYLIPLGCFLLLVVLFGIGLRHDPSVVPSPLIGQPLPAFELPTLHDPARTVTDAHLRGEVSLINVWASWCVACRYEHPLLVRLAREQQVPIYGLNYKDIRGDAVSWLQNRGDPYRLSLFDESGRVGIDFGVYGVPETFIIDRNGVVRFKHIGPIREETLSEEILPLLARLAAGAPGPG